MFPKCCFQASDILNLCFNVGRESVLGLWFWTDCWIEKDQVLPQFQGGHWVLEGPPCLVLLVQHDGRACFLFSMWTPQTLLHSPVQETRFWGPSRPPAPPVPAGTWCSWWRPSASPPCWASCRRSDPAGGPSVWRSLGSHTSPSAAPAHSVSGWTPARTGTRRRWSVRGGERESGRAGARGLGLSEDLCTGRSQRGPYLGGRVGRGRSWTESPGAERRCSLPLGVRRRETDGNAGWWLEQRRWSSSCDLV